jgi:ketol-acid reductoisomerase
MLGMDILKMMIDVGKQGKAAKFREKGLDLSVFLKKENKVKLAKLSSFSVLSTDKELLFSRCARFILSLVA